MILRILILSLLLVTACQKTKSERAAVESEDGSGSTGEEKSEGFWDDTVVNPIKKAKDTGKVYKEASQNRAAVYDDVLAEPAKNSAEDSE